MHNTCIIYRREIILLSRPVGTKPKACYLELCIIQGRRDLTNGMMAPWTLINVEPGRSFTTFFYALVTSK